MRRPIRLALTVSIAASAIGGGTALLTTGGASAAAFAGGDVVVYTVGNGTTALSNVAAPVSLKEFSPTGSLVQSLPLPTTDATGGQHALTAAGLSTSEGEITRSPDGRYLTVTGYDAPVGTNGPVVTSVQEGLTSTDPSSTARTIGRIDGNGLIDTSTAISGSNVPNIIRSASTTDGTHFLIGGGNGGLLTASLGASTATLDASNTSANNLNEVTTAGTTSTDSLTFAGSSDPGSRLYSASGGTLTALPGISATSLPYGYAFLKVGSGVGYAGTGLNTLYLVDAADRAGAIDKYVYSGTTWVEAGTIALDGALGLAAAPTTGNGVSLAVTTTTGLYTFTDPDGTATSGFSGSPIKIASAPTKTQFRGVAIAPVAPTGPSIVVESPAAGAKVPATTKSLAFSAEVASPDGIAGVTVGVDGTTTPLSASSPGGDVWNATIPLTGLAAGTHTLHITATDLSASSVQTTTTSTFTIEPPVSTIPKGDLAPGTTSFASTLIKHSGFKLVTIKAAPKYKGKHQGLTTAKTGTATFTYDGKNLVLHLLASKSSGELTVTIAGKKHTVDLYSKKSKTVTETYKQSKAKPYKVSIKALHKKTKKSKGDTVTLGWLVVSK
jgi:hypothetical protein